MLFLKHPLRLPFFCRKRFTQNERSSSRFKCVVRKCVKMSQLKSQLLRSNHTNVDKCSRRLYLLHSGIEFQNNSVIHDFCFYARHLVQQRLETVTPVHGSLATTKVTKMKQAYQTNTKSSSKLTRLLSRNKKKWNVYCQMVRSMIKTSQSSLLTSQRLISIKMIAVMAAALEHTQPTVSYLWAGRCDSPGVQAA